MCSVFWFSVFKMLKGLENKIMAIFFISLLNLCSDALELKCFLNTVQNIGKIFCLLKNIRVSARATSAHVMYMFCTHTQCGDVWSGELLKGNGKHYLVQLGFHLGCSWPSLCWQRTSGTPPQCCGVFSCQILFSCKIK